MTSQATAIAMTTVLTVCSAPRSGQTLLVGASKVRPPIAASSARPSRASSARGSAA
jgi:hypothetical protein